MLSIASKKCYNKILLAVALATVRSSVNYFSCGNWGTGKLDVVYILSFIPPDLLFSGNYNNMKAVRCSGQKV